MILAIRSVARITQFPGYDPAPGSPSFPCQLLAARRKLGLSLRRLAGHLAIDSGTLARWEKRPAYPSEGVRERVDAVLRSTNLDGLDETKLMGRNR